MASQTGRNTALAYSIGEESPEKSCFTDLYPQSLAPLDNHAIEYCIAPYTGEIYLRTALFPAV